MVIKMNKVLTSILEHKNNNNIHIITKRYTKGSIIFSEDETCEYVCFLKSGIIVAKNILIGGKESILRVFKPNEIIGDALIFSTENKYKATFYANTTIDILLISKYELIELLNTNKLIMEAYLKHLADSVVKINDHLKFLLQPNITAKISLLLSIEAKKRKSNLVNFSLNKTELAAYLNVERPSLSRILHKLQRDKIIKITGNNYEILNYNELS